MKVLITRHQVVDLALDSPVEWPMGMNNDHMRALKTGQATGFSIGNDTVFIQPFLAEHEDMVEKLQQKIEQLVS